MTSYSNTNGPSYTAYSWNGGSDAPIKAESTPTASAGGGVVYGPVNRPEATSADSAKDKQIDPDDLTIQVLVPPNELDGYNIVWRLATECKDSKLMEAAAKLLL